MKRFLFHPIAFFFWVLLPWILLAVILPPQLKPEIPAVIVCFFFYIWAPGVFLIHHIGLRTADPWELLFREYAIGLLAFSLAAVPALHMQSSLGWTLFCILSLSAIPSRVRRHMAIGRRPNLFFLPWSVIAIIFAACYGHGAMEMSADGLPHIRTRWDTLSLLAFMRESLRAFPLIQAPFAGGVPYMFQSDPSSIATLAFLKKVSGARAEIIPVIVFPFFLSQMLFLGTYAMIRRLIFRHYAILFSFVLFHLISQQYILYRYSWESPADLFGMIMLLFLLNLYFSSTLWKRRYAPYAIFFICGLFAYVRSIYFVGAAGPMALHYLWHHRKQMSRAVLAPVAMLLISFGLCALYKVVYWSAAPMPISFGWFEGTDVFLSNGMFADYYPEWILPKYGPLVYLLEIAGPLLPLLLMLMAVKRKLPPTNLTALRGLTGVIIVSLSVSMVFLSIIAAKGLAWYFYRILCVLSMLAIIPLLGSYAVSIMHRHPRLRPALPALLVAFLAVYGANFFVKRVWSSGMNHFQFQTEPGTSLFRAMVYIDNSTPTEAIIFWMDDEYGRNSVTYISAFTNRRCWLERGQSPWLSQQVTERQARYMAMRKTTSHAELRSLFQGVKADYFLDTGAPSELSKAIGDQLELVHSEDLARVFKIHKPPR